MKYDNFKILKFSTISKRINRIRDSFPTIHKNIKNILGYVADIFSYIIKYIFSEINQSIKFVLRGSFSIIHQSIKFVLRGSFSIIHKNIKTISKYVTDFFSYIIKYIFSEINQSIKFIIHNFSKIYKLIYFRKLNFKKFYKYLDIRRYVFYGTNKKINLENYKYLPIYFVGFIIFLGFVYVVVPIFYSYDKLKIEKTLCNNQNIECSIRGKVNYSFYPTPRIKIKDLIINDVFGKKNTLAAVEDATIKLSIKNLLVKEKHKSKSIKLNNFEINVNLKNLKE